MQPNQEEMMKTLGLGLITLLQKQGLTFMLMAFALVFLYNDNNQFKKQQLKQDQEKAARIELLEQHVKECNEDRIQIYQEQNQQFIAVMENISKHLKEF